MNPPAALGGRMAAEIAETPAVVRRVLDGAVEWADAFHALAVTARGVAFTGRGTSDHAAAYGRYVLEQALGVPAWSSAPSLITRYGADVDVAGVLSIAISQSGRTPEIVSVVDHCRANGASTVAVTNDVNSPLAASADVVAPLHAGPEVAVPATKTFSASQAVFAAMGARCAPERFALDVDRVADAVDATVADGAALDAAVEVLTGEPVIVHVGRGYLLPIAREGALKVIETTRVANLAWSPVDFRHGPYALVREGLPVVVHHTAGAVAEDTASLVGDLTGAGARVVTVGRPVPGTAAHIDVPDELPEHLAPFCHAVRVQQLALSLARAAGIDPDSPDGLRKVTHTD